MEERGEGQADGRREETGDFSLSLSLSVISGLAGFIYTQSCRIIGSPPPT